MIGICPHLWFDRTVSIDEFDAKALEISIATGFQELQAHELWLRYSSVYGAICDPGGDTRGMSWPRLK
jgi:hypothetical protein